jgi:hypothetical protein
LEHNHSWKEIEEHLHDAKEIESTSHAVKVLSIPLVASLNRRLALGGAYRQAVWIIVESIGSFCSACLSAIPVPLIKLPESGYKEKGDDDCLQNFSSRDSRLTLS